MPLKHDPNKLAFRTLQERVLQEERHWPNFTDKARAWLATVQLKTAAVAMVAGVAIGGTAVDQHYKNEQAGQAFVEAAVMEMSDVDDGILNEQPPSVEKPTTAPRAKGKPGPSMH